MAVAPDEYRLEDIAGEHRINAALFVPFIVHRLRGETEGSEATLAISIQYW